MGNGIELLQYLIHQQEQHPKQKGTYSRRGFSLSDIKDMINQDGNANLKNNEIKGFLIEKFGDSISFCDPERKNQSLFAFSSSIEVQDVINSPRNIDVVKTAAIEIRKSLLDINFRIENSFCDAHQLKQSWKETKIPEILLSFFAASFNISCTKLMRSEIQALMIVLLRIV